MKLDRTVLHRIGPFEHIELDLSKVRGRIVALVAPNGSGKSVLGECAIPGACWRKTPTRGSLADLATARDSYVESTITNGQRFTVRHTIDCATGKASTSLTDSAGSPILSTGKVSEFDAWAQEHLPQQGVVLASMFAAQGSGGFLALDPADRKKILLRAIGAERYEPMAELARKHAKEAAAELARLVDRIRDETERGGDLDSALARLREAEQATIEAEQATIEAGGRLDNWLRHEALLQADLARKVAELEGIERERSDHRRRAAEANSRGEAALSAHEAAKADMQAGLAAARARVVKTEQAIANNKRVLADKASIEEAVARNRELTAELEGLKIELATQRTRADALSQSRAAHQRESSRHHITLDRLRSRADAERKVVAQKDSVLEAQAEDDRLAESQAELTESLIRARVETERLSSAGQVSAEQRIEGLRNCLREISTWRADCHAYDDDVGYPHRSFDADTVAEIETRAQRGLRTDDSLREQADQFPRRLQEAKDLVNRLDASLETTRHARRKAQEVADRIESVEAAERTLADLERDIAVALEQENVEIASAAQDSKGLHTAKSTIDSIETQIKAIAAETAFLAPKLQLAERLSTAEARIQELEARKADEQGQADDLALSIDAFPLEPPGAEAEAEAATEALKEAEDAERRADVVRVVISRTNEELKWCTESVREARNDVAASRQRKELAVAASAEAAAEVERARGSGARLAELQDERVAIEEASADWTLLADSLGSKGIQALEADAAGPELTAMANDLLERAFGPRWTVSIETTRPGADGKREIETCEVTVIDALRGREGNAKTLSGGERVIVGEAVSLALSMLAAKSTAHGGSTIWRDESGAALDPENCPAWVAMLRRAADIVGAEHLVFVSHSPEAQALADARIYIDAGGTARISE